MDTEVVTIGSLGALMRQRRLDRELSQDQVGVRQGRTGRRPGSNINRYELGTSFPDKPFFDRWIAALDLTATKRDEAVSIWSAERKLRSEASWASSDLRRRTGRNPLAALSDVNDLVNLANDPTISATTRILALLSSIPNGSIVKFTSSVSPKLYELPIGQAYVRDWTTKLPKRNIIQIRYFNFRDRDRDLEPLIPTVFSHALKRKEYIEDKKIVLKAIAYDKEDFAPSVQISDSRFIILNTFVNDKGAPDGRVLGGKLDEWKHDETIRSILTTLDRTFADRTRTFPLDSILKDLRWVHYSIP